jgi:hypothetical protein
VGSKNVNSYNSVIARPDRAIQLIFLENEYEWEYYADPDNIPN